MLGDFGEEYFEDYLVSTFKYGRGFVTAWDCFYSNNVGNLHNIKGNIYRDIVEHQVLPVGKYLLAEHYIFMDDDNSKHTSKII